MAAPEVGDPGAAAWVVATGIEEPGLVFESWWWVSDVTGIDLASGTRASGAPTNELEAALVGVSGWELRQRHGSAESTDAPAAGGPTTGAWMKIEVWTDQLGRSRLLVDGVVVTTWTDQSASPLTTGSAGLRAGVLASGADWFVDDARVRKLITPEPLAALGPLDRE